MSKRDHILEVYSTMNAYLIKLSHEVKDIDRKLTLQRAIHQPRVYFKKFSAALRSEGSYERVRNKLRSELEIKERIGINTIGKAIVKLYSSKQ